METQTNTVPALRFSSFGKDWEPKKFGAITSKVGSGKTPRGGSKVYTNQGIFFIRSQNVNNNQLDLGDLTFIPNEVDEEMANSRVEPDDILLNITGASIGRSCVVPSNFKTGNVNQHVCIIRLLSDYDSRFLQPLLASSRGQKLIEIGQTGSGREGLNFQSIRGFFAAFPTLPEQRKIADFLMAVDGRIGQLIQKKALLTDYKKGVMQQLFTQAIRFKDDHGNDFPDWEEKKLGEVLYEHKEKSDGAESVFSVSVHKGLVDQVEHLGRSFAAASTAHYNRVNPNNVVYTKSPTGDFPLGIIKQAHISESVIVSPLYAVFKPESSGLGRLLELYFESPCNVHNYLHSLIQKGAKNTFSINNATFLSKRLPLPVSQEEQQKIGEFFAAIDRRIECAARQITETQTFKRGLLQQMFV